MTTLAGPFVGLLLLSHGPLANALRETVHMLEPDEPDDLGSLSLAWDESPEAASRRLEKAIAEVNRGKGVVLLTDMFGGTPSNLGMTFLETDKVEVITGVNLPMLIKLTSLSETSNLLAVAREMRDDGRNAIWVASDLLRSEKTP